MRRENECSRLVVDGNRTDDGECCSLVVKHELGASEHSERPAGVAHLLTADDVLADGNQCGTYLAVCGALVPTSSLPSSLCPPGCECDCALYCPQCVRHVVQYAMESAKSGEDEADQEPSPHREYPAGALGTALCGQRVTTERRTQITHSGGSSGFSGNTPLPQSYQAARGWSPAEPTATGP